VPLASPVHGPDGVEAIGLGGKAEAVETRRGDSRRRVTVEAKIELVEGKIRQAFADEDRTGRLANAVLARAVRGGERPSQQGVENAVRFVRDYVSHVPAYMRGALEAARMAGVEPEMRQVLEMAASYWTEAEDIIPDRLGLLGVLDDAYCSLSFIQAVSDHYEVETGRPLLSRNLRAANEAMRRFLGEPTASQLDMYVGNELKADPMMQMVRALTAVSATGGSFRVDPVESIWDDRPTEEMVRSLLGGVGLA
jgi:uncharacterized membrane protein YkvA (DUF1232 family)